MTRKTFTSSEIKQRWEDKTYAKYLVRLRYDKDKDLIKWIEKHKEELGMSNIFREGAYLAMREHKKK